MAKFNLKPIEQNGITQYSHTNMFNNKSFLDGAHLYLTMNEIFNDLVNPIYINTTVDYDKYLNINKHQNFALQLKLKFFKQINFNFELDINVYNIQNHVSVYLKYIFFKQKKIETKVLKKTYIKYNYEFYENYVTDLYKLNTNYYTYDMQQIC